MSSKQLWLEAMYPRVRSWLPAAPSVVLELGCGSAGGFVPALLSDGFQAVGIDPEAPEGTGYRRIEFERSELPDDVDAVVASVSLHHVEDTGKVLDRVAAALKPGGTVVVIEWDWESFDEPSARWGFERLDWEAEDRGWLHRGHEHWVASGQPWEEYLRGWATGHGLHSARALVEGLDERFERVSCERGAYLFPELAHTTEDDELQAIESGLVRALRIDYVGVIRRRPRLEDDQLAEAKPVDLEGVATRRADPGRARIGGPIELGAWPPYRRRFSMPAGAICACPIRIG